MAAADFPNPPLIPSPALIYTYTHPSTHARTHAHTQAHARTHSHTPLLLQNIFYTTVGAPKENYKVAIFDRFVSVPAMLQKGRVVACDLASDSYTRQVCRIRE